MTQDKKIEEMHLAKIKRWDNSSLGAQIGGCLHDAVALSIFDKDTTKIRFWLDILYDIAEEKKQDITAIKPVDFIKAEKLGQRIKEIDRREEQEKIDDINDILNREKAEQNNIPF